MIAYFFAIAIAIFKIHCNLTGKLNYRNRYRLDYSLFQSAQTRKIRVWLIDRLTHLPYSRFTSRLVDRLLVSLDSIEGGANHG